MTEYEYFQKHIKNSYFQDGDEEFENFMRRFKHDYYNIINEKKRNSVVNSQYLTVKQFAETFDISVDDLNDKTMETLKELSVTTEFSYTELIDAFRRLSNG